MSRSVRRATFSLLGLAACLTVILSYESLLPEMSRWLNVGEAPDCVDHLLVLPGDDTYRPVLAAALVNAGLAKNILVPETVNSPDVMDGLQPPTAVILSQILRHRGIPRRNILFLKGASRTTFDDARALLSYLEDRPADRVIVITSAFHTRRARFIFRRVLDVGTDRLRFVAAPNPGFADENWWQHRSGARIVLSEYLKLAFYLFRYSNLHVWMSGFLLIAIVWFLRRHRTNHRKPTAADRSAR